MDISEIEEMGGYKIQLKIFLNFQFRSAGIVAVHYHSIISKSKISIENKKGFPSSRYVLMSGRLSGISIVRAIVVVVGIGKEYSKHNVK